MNAPEDKLKEVVIWSRAPARNLKSTMLGAVAMYSGLAAARQSGMTEEQIRTRVAANQLMPL